MTEKKHMSGKLVSMYENFLQGKITTIPALEHWCTSELSECKPEAHYTILSNRNTCWIQFLKKFKSSRFFQTEVLSRKLEERC